MFVVGVLGTLEYFNIMNISQISDSDLAKDFANELEVVDYDEESGILYVNNRIIVVVASNCDIETVALLAGNFGVTLDDSMADIGIFAFEFEETKKYAELQSIIENIKDNLWVQEAYLDVVFNVSCDDIGKNENELLPSDPWNSASWNCEVPREENWGVEAINAPGGWVYLDQMTPIRIGLIDSMPNTLHEDLRHQFAEKITIIINDKTGKQCIDNSIISADNHGTHVSGTINGEWNNVGVSGIMGGKGKLYYCGVFFEHNGTYYSDYYTGYTYMLALKTLIDSDVQLINISQNTNRLIGFAASHGNQNAINYLTEQAKLASTGLSRIINGRKIAGKSDFIICVAAGNNNSTYYYKDNGKTYGYREKMNWREKIKSLFGWRGEIGGSEAKYNNFLNLIDEQDVKNHIVVVGAIKINNEKSTGKETVYEYAYFSNIGKRVDIVAPGYEVYSSVVNGYDSLSGTSMATPHVTGVAGLIFACNPNLTAKEVRDILENSTTETFHFTNGNAGLLNAKNAIIDVLQRSQNTNQIEILPNEGGLLSSERNVALTLDISGSMSGTPMEETKKASSNFINTILEQDASIGIVTYDNASNIASDFSTDREALQSIVSGLYDGGGTNIEAGLRDAQGMLEKTNAKKKIIVLMSDGEPNDGLIDEDLIAYADEIKKSGTIIYTIGFFESLFERSYAQYLMECIASDGCHYEVANADQLAFFFEDMADQINGQKYIYVRIACPVDVSVTFDGETLDSSEGNLSERTSFGTLTFEENREKSDSGADDRVKVLRLKDGADYDLKLTGTGHGIMNYTIGFMDDNGDYSDLRKFENIKITRKTQIDTVASNSDDSMLNIDEDGDGKYDIRLRAEANGYGEKITTSNWIIYVIIGAVIFILLDIAVIVIYTKHKKRKGE